MNGIKTKHLIIEIVILVIGYYWAVAAYADYQNEKAYKEAIDVPYLLIKSSAALNLT